MSPLYALLWGEPTAALAAARALGPADWRRLDRTAAQHRLRPMLHARAAPAWGVPAELLAHWSAADRRAALRALKQRAELTRVLALLAEAGIPAAALKGAAFVWNGWINPAHRPMRDLDVLVPAGMAKAADAALRAAGYAGGSAMSGGKHLPALTGSAGIAVELHVHLHDTWDEAGAARDAAFAARALARAVPTPAGLALAPTDTLLHLILHAVIDHQFNNGPLLLGDLAVLMGKAAIDWEQFWAEAEALQAVRACQLALRLGETMVPGLVADWQGHAPDDLAPAILERAAAAMLVDMSVRSLVGWPAQVLRLPARQRMRQIVAMLSRYRRRTPDERAAGGQAGQPVATSALRLLSREGRSSLSNSARLALWLHQKR